MQKERVKMGRKEAQILGTDLNSTREGKVLIHLKFFLAKRHPFEAKYRKIFIVTPNPEQVLLALKNKNFREILNKADFSLPDGIGLSQAAFFINQNVSKNRVVRIFNLLLNGVKTAIYTFSKRQVLFEALPVIHGSDFFESLMVLGNKMKLKYVFLGGAGEVAEKSASNVCKNYKNLEVLGLSGPSLNYEGLPKRKADEIFESDLIEKINKFEPDMVFVGFGAPKQEKWVDRNFGNVKTLGFMAVGGTFDYVSGKVPIPPAWVKRLELEWLWRLVTQFRIKRVFNAVVVFPWKIFLSKLEEK